MGRRPKAASPEVIEYSRDLFAGATIERLAGHFTRLLSGAVAEPHRRLGELPLLSPIEREQLLVEESAAPPPPHLTLHGLFEAQAARTPAELAVLAADGRLTYAELDARANQLAAHLRGLGVGAEVLVGLCLERSLDMVVGLLAVLKAGGAYVPLDPEYPAERLAQMLADARIEVVLTQERLLSVLPEPRPPLIICLDTCLDTEAEVIATRSRRPADPAAALPAEGLALAYVLFTSGSTGRPKGVAIPQRAIVNHMLWMQSEYPLQSGDRVLQKTPFSFDASVWELYAPLIAGATLVMAQPGGHRDPAYLVAAVREHGVTILQAVPALLRALLDDGGFRECRTLRRVFCGGETLGADLQRDFFARFAGTDTELVNLYGPTEAAIDTSSWRCQPGRADRPALLGRPITNSRIHVLSPEGEICPLGVPGEIAIGGLPVARGYLGRPDDTAARFVPDAFGAEPGGRLYRSGDLGRRLAGGELEFLGRLDHQVKVRGFRVELAEVESTLLAQAAVRAAVVLARPDSSGSMGLVAYVAAAPGALSAGELRQHLKARLPEYMVPAAYGFLESLPLTPSSKVDRRALAALPLAGGEPAVSVAPRTPAEELVAGIFAEVLGLAGVGAGDSFFELGGHSLLATQVASRVRSVFGVELPVRAVFEAPTVAALAAWIEARRAGGAAAEAAPAIRPLLRGTAGLALSFAQSRLWFLDQLEPGSAQYNIPAAVRLTGELDRGAFAAALGEIVRRHEVLRSTFRSDGGQPLQLVSPASGISGIALPVVDLAALPAAARRDEAQRWIAGEARRPFDLARGPLLRATLLALGAGEHLALFTLHHIVSDGWSTGVLVRELGALYAAFRAAAPSPLPELAVQYADYAAWQRRSLSGARLAAELAFWRRELAGAPPALDLPVDHPRPAAFSGRGALHGFRLDAAGLAGLDRLSRRQGTTLFMTLLAGFAALLRRYTGADDVAVGSPIAGRTRIETEPLIGLFVNTLVLRTDLAGDPAFTDLLGRVREATLAAYAHQEVPFERLVEELAPVRDGSRPPLVQAMLSLQNAPQSALSLPGLALETLAVETGTAKLELTVTFAESADGLAGTIEYARDLFDRPTIERLADGLARLLAGAAAAPRTRLSELPLLGAAEVQQALVEWNDTWSAYPREASLPELFAAMADERPEAAAIVAGDEVWSYRRLDEVSNRLARHLRSLGVGIGTPVCLSLERSPELVAGILAILKAGGVYVPLDASYPDERLELMLADAGAAIVLVHAATRERLAGRARLVALDGDEWTGEDAGPLGMRVPAEAVAYVIYTSGSTGRPKGVAVPHRAVVRLVRETSYVSLGPGDRLGQVANISFDAATWEIWGALLNGAAVVVVPREVALSTEAFAALLRAQRVTALFLTTALFNKMSREVPAAFASLDHLLFGGEAVDPSAARAVLAAGGPRRLLHVYGPT